VNPFDPSTVYCQNSQEIAMERFEDGPVMINFLTGRYFSLNPWAELIWNSLATGQSEGQLLSALGKLPVTQAVPSEQLTADIRSFLGILIEQRLVAVTQNSQASSSLDLFAMMPPIYEAPSLEIFDDLADLILLDPIHDVNESLGWPVAQKPEN
jgi:hypothetical protein